MKHSYRVLEIVKKEARVGERILKKLWRIKIIFKKLLSY